MQMVGTQNAHNLITSSTDGMVCSWLVDMLAQPQVGRVVAITNVLRIHEIFASRKLLSWCMLDTTRREK